MTAWALGSVADPHAPIRTMEEARDDLRTQLRRPTRPSQYAALLRQIAGLEAEIARKAKETPNA